MSSPLTIYRELEGRVSAEGVDYRVSDPRHSRTLIPVNSSFGARDFYLHVVDTLQISRRDKHCCPASTMHYFRKKTSPPEDTTSPARSIANYIKQELGTSYPRVKGRRALVASSSAIAMTLASPSCDPTDVAFNDPGATKESAWRAAYGAAGIAIDIAKDCSDMLPPLKAVMVALSVLIKNYDVGYLLVASRPT